MAPTSARHLAGIAATIALVAGCTGTPESRTEVSDATAPPAPTTTAPAPPSSPSASPSGQPVMTPSPPDLSGVTIDCRGIDEPCDHGDDPDLDALWDACAEGTGGACDRLYYDSGFDTRYEQFGNTCGDRDVTVPCPSELTP